VFQRLIWLSVAGACGTVSRYTLCELAHKFKPCPLPLGTLAVNVIGSFLFGLIYMAAQNRTHIPSETRSVRHCWA
jgi:fluoride exporter